MDASYYCFRGTGKLRIDLKPGSKHFEPWWALVLCDEEICNYYAWHLKKWGREIEYGRLWGAHISAIKGEEPRDKSKWRKINQTIEFWYTNQICYDNGKHAWLNVYSPQLSEIRVSLGLSVKPRYHLTIGRLKLQ